MNTAPVLSIVPATHRARTATVIGREHVRLGRNNQDGAWTVETRTENPPFRLSSSKPAEHRELNSAPFDSAQGERRVVTTAVLCDGCGSEPRSEVGAQLGARFLAQWLAREASRSPLTGALAESATAALVDWLRAFVELMEPEPSRRAAFVQAHLLFTFLAAVASEGRVLVFGLGDGVVSVDGVTRVLDSGPENAPDYVAYRLARPGAAPALHVLGPASRVALGTDGLAAHLTAHPNALEPLFDDAAVWKNPAQLQRRLNVLAAQERFSDDATLALLREEA
jgi:hypothetical protein